MVYVDNDATGLAPDRFQGVVGTETVSEPMMTTFSISIPMPIRVNPLHAELFWGNKKIYIFALCIISR